MTYVEAIEKLKELGPEVKTGRAGDAGKPRKYSLDDIRVLLAAMGDPQAKFRSVLIAGTNGKGSTSATLASVLTAAGVKTGLYTSPHLLHVTERVRVSAGEPAALFEIPEADFGRVFGYVWETAETLVREGKLPHTPSFFELLTAVAFVYFAEERVELAVLEVGLGGRLDATNIVEPIISVITDIGMDHMEFLGDTITLIAREKAGILRENGVLVTLSQHQEANAAIGSVAVELGVRGVDAARCLPPRDLMSTGGARAEGASPLPRNVYDLSIDGELIHVDSPLAGAHQQRNLALAIATALELRANHGVAISNAAIEQGVSATKWPGRLEFVTGRMSAAHQPHAPLLMDVAHNPAGAWALRGVLSQLPEEMPRTLVFSCLADKPVTELAKILFPLFDSASGDPLRARDHIVLAPMQNPRASTLDELLAVAHGLDIPAHGAPHIPAALAQAEAVTPRDGIIVATGSIFLIGELRAFLMAEGTVGKP